MLRISLRQLQKQLYDRFLVEENLKADFTPKQISLASKFNGFPAKFDFKKKQVQGVVIFLVVYLNKKETVCLNYYYKNNLNFINTHLIDLLNNGSMELFAHFVEGDNEFAIQSGINKATAGEFFYNHVFEEEQCLIVCLNENQVFAISSDYESRLEALKKETNEEKFRIEINKIAKSLSATVEDVLQIIKYIEYYKPLHEV